MKIFVSYSRLDSDLGTAVYNYLRDAHEVFIDTKKIAGGDEWEKIIKTEISKCDRFIVILTLSSIKREEVKKEIDVAIDKKKKIIPCIHNSIEIKKVPAELKKYNGVQFEEGSELGLKLLTMINIEEETRFNNEEKNIASNMYDEKQDERLTENKHRMQPSENKEQSKNLRDILKSFIKIEKRKTITICSVITAAIFILIFIFIIPFIALFPPNHAKEYNLFDSPIPSNNDNESSVNNPSSANSNPSVLINNSPIRTTMNQTVNIPLLGKDHNDDLNKIIVSKPRNGNLSNTDQARGIVTYTPYPGFTGTDEFTFKVNDKKKSDNNTGTVHIIINQPL